MSKTTRNKKYKSVRNQLTPYFKEKEVEEDLGESLYDNISYEEIMSNGQGISNARAIRNTYHRLKKKLHRKARKILKKNTKDLLNELL